MEIIYILLAVFYTVIVKRDPDWQLLGQAGERRMAVSYTHLDVYKRQVIGRPHFGQYGTISGGTAVFARVPSGSRGSPDGRI